MPYDTKPITVQPGVCPLSDTTLQSTPHWTFSDKVRFKDGFPEKIGGWDTLFLAGNYQMQGLPRNIFSYIMGNVTYYLVGTNSNLYSITGNRLYNATPISNDSETLTDVLSSYYNTLGTDPMSVVMGSYAVTVTDVGHPFKSGDILSFSGATGFGGISGASLAGAKSISNVTENTYQFNVNALPTSTSTGGGAAVVRTSRLVHVDDANTFNEGDNILIDSVASSVGGILPADMVGQRIVRGVTALGYDFLANTYATSSEIDAGGDVEIFSEIPDGPANSTTGGGYGLGQYGEGLYGVSKSSFLATSPAIWSFDRFGDLVITTRGNQSPLYSWNNTTSTLPMPVASSPETINYAYVTDNIAVTFGADGVPNRIKYSDQGNLTTWTATAQNQAGEDDIEGAGEFISHASLRGMNLHFTRSSVYSWRYIGKPNVFENKLIDGGRGLIGRNARVVVNGVAFWQGLDNFYMYRGGNVEIIPSNTGPESTLKDYVFNNIDPVNSLKSFAWYNSRFNEIWFHYPSIGSQECDRVARYNVLDKTWCPDTMPRTAGEYPNVLGIYPYLTGYSTTFSIQGSFSSEFSVDFDIGNPDDPDITASPLIFRHENGYDNDGAQLPWSCTTPYFSTGAKDTLVLGGVYQDNTINTGNIYLTVNTKRYPNQLEGSSTYPISTENANLIYRKSARYWQYSVSGSALTQSWRGGSWMELIKRGSKR